MQQRIVQISLEEYEAMKSEVEQLKSKIDELKENNQVLVKNAGKVIVEMAVTVGSEYDRNYIKSILPRELRFNDRIAVVYNKVSFENVESISKDIKDLAHNSQYKAIKSDRKLYEAEIAFNRACAELNKKINELKKENEQLKAPKTFWQRLFN